MAEPSPVDKPQRTVLIPVDGSANSDRAFERYLTMFSKSEDLVYVVHVHQPPSIKGLALGSVPGSFVSDSYIEEVNESLKKSKDLLESYKQKLEEKKLEFKLLLKSSEGNGPGETIVKLCHELKPVIVFIGNRGLGSFSRMFLGSVSDYVVHHSECAVCVVPPK